MKKLIRNTLWAFSLFLIYTISGFLFGTHEKMIVVTLVTTFLLTFLYFKNNPSKKAIEGFLLLVAPTLMIFITTSLFAGFKRSLVYLIFIPLVYYLSWFFVERRRSKLILIFVLGIIVFAPTIFIPNIYSYYLNKNAEQNRPLPEMTFIDANKNIITLSKNKVLVLDFWNTSCGVCFKKFPEYEDLYLEYKNNQNVEFYSVNMPMKRDEFPSVLKLVDSLDYKYKTIFAESTKDIDEKLNITGYPTFMIIKNNRIRFSGYQNNGSNIFIYNSKSIIDNLLKE